MICDRLEGVAVPLSHGVFAVVDNRDAERVLAHRWHLHRNGSRTYAIRRDGRARRAVLLHRFVVDASPGQIVDHRDGDGLNNTRANLRLASNQQNAWNGRAKGEVPLRGVRVVGDKFAASIWPNNRHINLGTTYATAEQASAVYNAAAVALYGEFARPSGIEPDFVTLRAVIERRGSGWELLASALERV